MAKAVALGADRDTSGKCNAATECWRPSLNGFVQRLKQLHLLLGVLTGWLLLLIIFSGSLSFYRAELDNLQLFKLQAEPLYSETTAIRSAAVAQTFLTQHASHAMQWYIELPQPRKPYLTLHWLQPAIASTAAEIDDATTRHSKNTLSSEGRPQLYQQLLHATSGEPLSDARPVQFGSTEHQLGGVFFQLHYNLLQVFGPFSRSLVAYAALLWLLLSVAGLLSLRGRWRTLWQIKPSPLNAETSQTLRHNQLALFTLPFALLFASSGWLTQMFSDNPAPQRQLYPEQPYQFFAEFFPPAQPFAGMRQDDPAPLPDLAALVIAAEQQFGQPVGKMSLTLPGTAQGTVLITGSAAAQVSNHLPHALFIFEKSQWQQQRMVSTSTSLTPIAQSRSVWYGLHQSLYASPGLRFGLFLFGILCCWMIWLGLRSGLQRPSALIWQRWVLPTTAITLMSFAIGSLVLMLLQLLPTELLLGWTLSQQLVTLISGTGLVLFVVVLRKNILF
jgi:hypothetical protein